MFGICNFDFVLLWHGSWYECIVWVIMGQGGGYSQNAGVLFVLVFFVMFHQLLFTNEWIFSIIVSSSNIWLCSDIKIVARPLSSRTNDLANENSGPPPAPVQRPLMQERSKVQVGDRMELIDNTLRAEQNGGHFADILKYNCWPESCWMWFKFLWNLFLTHWDEAKWTPSSRQHFEMHFLEWKYMNFA